MSLFYPPTERVSRGKTADKEDMVNVRFLELEPPRKIAEAVSFATNDPAFLGEMTMTATTKKAASKSTKRPELKGGASRGQAAGRGV